MCVYLYEDCDNTMSSGRVDLPGPDWVPCRVRLSEKGPDSREERAERREVGSLGEQRRVSTALGHALGIAGSHK